MNTSVEQTHIVRTVVREFLQIDDGSSETIIPTVLKFVEGAANQATARSGLRKRVAEIGQAADDHRLNLCLDTAHGLAWGYVHWAKGQDPDVIDLYPALRFSDWFHKSEPVNWVQRWRESGGQVFGGAEMVALRNDPIWSRLSVLGLPFPPFDIGSGMDVEDVARDEAENLGLICPDGQVALAVTDLNFGPALRQRLTEYFNPQA